jgi:hypothetical protein
MEIEVFRNNPPGARCKRLTENVMRAIVELIDNFDGELSLKILYPTEGITAPAIVVNGELLGENLSMDDILNKFSPEGVSKIIKDKSV